MNSPAPVCAHEELLAAGRRVLESLPRLQAGDTCAGLTVRGRVDNTSSIEATLGSDYESFGLRAVPIHLLGPEPAPGVRERLAQNERIANLAEAIRASGEITPLIIVLNGRTAQREEPAYVLEGSHRIDALELLEAKTIPALVVLDTDLDPDVRAADGRLLTPDERFATPWATPEKPGAVLSGNMSTNVPNDESLLRGAAVLPDPEAQYIEAAAQEMVSSAGVGKHLIAGLQGTYPDRELALQAARLMVRARYATPGAPLNPAEAAYYEALARGTVQARGVGDHVLRDVKIEFPTRGEAVDVARSLIHARHAPAETAPEV